MDRAQRQKKLLILLPFLIVVAVLVWLPNFQNNEASQDNDSQILVPMDLNEGDLLTLLSAQAQVEPRKKSEYDEWGRNPFLPDNWSSSVETAVTMLEDVEEIVTQPSVVLNGIFWNRSKPSALINNEVVGRGEKFGAYKVIEISKERVLLSDGMNDLKLKVLE